MRLGLLGGPQCLMEEVFVLLLVDCRDIPSTGTDTVGLQDPINCDKRGGYSNERVPARCATLVGISYGVPCTGHRFADLLPPQRHRCTTPLPRSFFELTCFALSTQYTRVMHLRCRQREIWSRMKRLVREVEVERKRKEGECVQSRCCGPYR